MAFNEYSIMARVTTNRVKAQLILLTIKHVSIPRDIVLLRTTSIKKYFITRLIKRNMRLYLNVNIDIIKLLRLALCAIDEARVSGVKVINA